MKKIIDYLKLRELFDEKFIQTRQLILNGETHLNNLAEGFKEADEVIFSLPTVDAVEVVRCKDCKHSRERNEHEKQYLIEGILICTSCDATDECWNPVFPEHFCSYGEKSTT